MQPREGCWSVVRLTIVPFGSVRKLRRTSTKSLSDSTNVTPFFGFVDEELPGKGFDGPAMIYSRRRRPPIIPSPYCTHNSKRHIT